MNLRLLRNYNEDDVLAKVLLLYFAFQHGAIGVIMLFEDLSLVYKTSTVDAMASMLPMELWGVLLLFVSVSFVIAAIQESKLSYVAMIVSGSIGFVIFGLIAMASIELAGNLTNSINYIVIASIDALIAIIGGMAIWLRKTR